MLQYKVTVEPNDGIKPGAFVGLNIGGDGWIDSGGRLWLDSRLQLLGAGQTAGGWTADGAEVYDIYSEWPIDRQLDNADGVIEYELINE